ncbi:MAG TPA: DUF1232 domain-containing protein [Dehalococcoidia bacterium]|jgi:uncharacterized membrane protein YkvA (DUF1232 family)|nr:DUF1232 domain-containing protein [Dehalococcoidia bacterium]
MPFLLRILAIPVIWLIVRRQRASRTATLREIEKLGWNDRLSMTWRLVKDDRVPFYARPLVLFPALYMLSPIDLLPDFIPVIGKLDDAFVVSTAYSMLSALVPESLLQEHLQATRSPKAATP